MPELPEVQTVVSDLNRKIKGDVITGFWSDFPSTIKNATLENFKKKIIGRKILGARRIGKNIFIDLSGEKTLYIHLKMTGHLLVKSKNLKVKSYFDDKVNSYIHHIWNLGKDKTLEFSDVRKFAKIILDDTKKINNLKEIKALGIDAMDSKFNLKKFEKILEKSKQKPIGIVLMEQESIAGIGNIYRSEILFDAGINPFRKSSSLSKKETKKIFNSIKKILKKAIKMRGTSDSDYRDTSGAPGNFHKVLKVYRKHGQKCLKCDTIILRKKIAQRSVFYCSKCQK